MLSTLSLVSGSAAGIPYNGESTLNPMAAGASGTGPRAALSADGAKLLFTSDATNLVANALATPENNIYLRDTHSGKVSLLSVTPDGKAGDGAAMGGIISPDGRYVAFQSWATNLSPIDASTPADAYGPGSSSLLYLRDLSSGTTTLLDATPDGKPANPGYGDSQFVFSPDSRSLAFVSSATSLTTTPSEPPVTPPVDPSIPSDPMNPAPQPTPSTVIYVRDLASGTTTVANVTRDGKIPAPPPSPVYYAGGGQLVFSPDGRTLAFSESATNLTSDGVPDPRADATGALVPYSVTNLFVRDLDTGTTSLLTVSTGGKLGDAISYPAFSGVAVFSPDGKRVAFTSTATDLTDDPIPTADGSLYAGTNLFVRDLAAGTTTLVTRSVAGALGTTLQGSGGVSDPLARYVSTAVFSPDGKSLAFGSTATDLTGDPVATPPVDASGQSVSIPSLNLFVADLASRTISAVTLTTTGELSVEDSTNIYGGNPGFLFSPDGKSLLFTSDVEGLTSLPTEPLVNNMQNYLANGDTGRLYLRDLVARTTTPVSVTIDGKVAAGSNPVFSPDGKAIAFDSASTGLTTNAPDLQYRASSVQPDNVFLRDLTSGKTTLLSASVDGLLGNNVTGAPTFSPDGQTVYFTSAANELVPLDRNGSLDIFAVDLTPAPVVPPVPTVLALSASGYSARETLGALTITVNRTGSLSGAASVSYATADGSARAGTDYLATSGTLEFADGQASRSFSIALASTNRFDGPRTVLISLTGAKGATLGTSSATLTLTADHPAVVTPVLASTPVPTTPSPAPVTASPAPTVMTPTQPITTNPVVQTVRIENSPGRSSRLVVTLTGTVDPAMAADPSHYNVIIPSVSGARHAAFAGRLLTVKSVSYNAATHTATLTLAHGRKPHKPVRILFA